MKPPPPARLASLLAAHSLWLSWGMEQQLVSRGGHGRKRGHKPNIPFCKDSCPLSLSWGVGGRSPALNENWNGNNALGRHIQELNWDCALWLNMAVELHEWKKKLTVFWQFYIYPLWTYLKIGHKWQKCNISSHAISYAYLINGLNFENSLQLLTAISCISSPSLRPDEVFQYCAHKLKAHCTWKTKDFTSGLPGLSQDSSLCVKESGGMKSPSLF